MNKEKWMTAWLKSAAAWANSIYNPPPGYMNLSFPFELAHEIEIPSDLDIFDDLSPEDCFLIITHISMLLSHMEFRVTLNKSLILKLMTVRGLKMERTIFTHHLYPGQGFTAELYTGGVIVVSDFLDSWSGTIAVYNVGSMEEAERWIKKVGKENVVSKLMEGSLNLYKPPAPLPPIFF